MELFNKIFYNKNENISNFPIKGFDFNYTMDEYSAIRNKKYNISTINRHLEILKECGNLINTTKKPDVFFNRYLIALAILNDLIPIEKKVHWQGDKPSQIKQQFYSKETLTVNDFIDRYYEDTMLKITSLKTDKAKQKKIEDFCNGLDKYKIYLSQESLNKYNDLCLELKNR